jgi:chloride channel protein, CIC family
MGNQTENHTGEEGLGKDGQDALPLPMGRSWVKSVFSKNFQITGKKLLIFVAIGCISGLGAVLFHLLCELGIHYFMDALAGYRPVTPGGEHPLLPRTDTPLTRWLLLILPAAGGLVSGWIVYTFAPEAEGHGTDAAIDAYHSKGGVIRGRVPLVKTIASAVTLTTGGSGGREGPIAQIGAGFGSFLATRLKLSERERRIMLAAGIGAGVGSIFRAPLAGALFAAEVLYSDAEFESDVLIPAGIASVVAYCIFCLFFGWGSLFKAPDFHFTNPLQLGPYLILTAALIGMGRLYVKCFYGIHDLFKRWNIPNHVKPAIGGLCTGLIGFYLPETLAFGYGVVQQSLHSELPWLLLLAVAFGKILTTSFTIGSGGSGGVFGPSMVIGGCLGGAVGLLFAKFMPGVVDQPGAFVIVGMAGFFTSVSSTPVSTIIMVSEMTGSYRLLLPSLMVCFLCHLFSRNCSIYKKQVPTKYDSPAHAGDFFLDILQAYRVKDVKNALRVVAVVPEDMDFKRFKELFCCTDQHYFPVVDDELRLSGIFSSNDFREFLFTPDIEELVLVKDIAFRDIIVTTLEEDLNTVLNKFTRKNIEQMPVVHPDDHGIFLGMLGRREIIGFYNDRVREMKEKSARAMAT